MIVSGSSSTPAPDFVRCNSGNSVPETNRLRSFTAPSSPTFLTLLLSSRKRDSSTTVPAFRPPFSRSFAQQNNSIHKYLAICQGRAAKEASCSQSGARPLDSPEDCCLRMSSIVYYTVQGDRDDPEHPNAFAIAKPYDRIVVGDVREAFPLSGTFQ